MTSRPLKMSKHRSRRPNHKKKEKKKETHSVINSSNELRRHLGPELKLPEPRHPCSLCATIAGDKTERTAFLKCQTVGVLAEISPLPSPPPPPPLPPPPTLLSILIDKATFDSAACCHHDILVTLFYPAPPRLPLPPGSPLNRNLTMRFNTGSIATPPMIHSLA